MFLTPPPDCDTVSDDARSGGLKRREPVATKIARLNDDPHVPFSFHKGERVALRRNDASADPEMRGLIVDGHCEYENGGGWYEDDYIVRREDGSTFRAGHLDLIKLE
jgi:hypothetical protein